MKGIQRDAAVLSLKALLLSLVSKADRKDK